MRLAAALLMLAGAVLSACSLPSSGGGAVPQGYLHLGPLDLPVRRIEIDRGGPALTPDAQPLADAAYLWADDRLRAAGGGGLARFVIRRAEIRERPYVVPGQRGDDRMVTRAVRYEARLEAEIQFLTDAGLPRGVAVGRGGSLVLLAEDASPAEQDRAFDRLLAQAITGMNEEFDRALRR